MRAIGLDRYESMNDKTLMARNECVVGTDNLDCCGMRLNSEKATAPSTGSASASIYSTPVATYAAVTKRATVIVHERIRPRLRFPSTNSSLSGVPDGAKRSSLGMVFDQKRQGNARVRFMLRRRTRPASRACTAR